MGKFRFTITRHTDRLFRYRWEVNTPEDEYVDNSYSITQRGARRAARKAIKRYNHIKKSGIDTKTPVIEEEL